MESNRKSLLDNLGQEAQTFLNEGRQSEKKEKLKSKKTDFFDESLEDVAITMRIPRKLYEALVDASFQSKRKKIKGFFVWFLIHIIWKFIRMRITVRIFKIIFCEEKFSFWNFFCRATSCKNNNRSCRGKKYVILLKIF